MNIITSVLVVVIAIEHIGFLYLEMFLWATPRGQKIFKTEEGFALQTKALAANQGLYNGFLAAGLIWSLIAPDPEFAYQLKLFFVSCVVVAGLFGWQTVSKTILYVQALPAFATLILLLTLS